MPISGLPAGILGNRQLLLHFRCNTARAGNKGNANQQSYPEFEQDFTKRKGFNVQLVERS